MRRPFPITTLKQVQEEIIRDYPKRRKLAKKTIYGIIYNAIFDTLELMRNEYLELVNSNHVVSYETSPLFKRLHNLYEALNYPLFLDIALTEKDFQNNMSNFVAQLLLTTPLLVAPGDQLKLL